MSDEMGFMIPDEPQVMQRIVDSVLAAIQTEAAATSIPMPVAVNAMATAMARITMMAMLSQAQERAGGQAFEMEVFRRVIDAVASMEDFRDRKAPWRLQSSKLKQLERTSPGSVGVMDMTGHGATKQ